MFGAAIGALPAFILVGFAVLVGIAAGLSGSQFDVLGQIAFGPVLGPHISFAGGVAAAAFAARRERDDIDDGTNIVTPLAGLGDPLPLLVGGIFGAGGYLLQLLLTALIPPVEAGFYTTYTDVIALVVVISAIIARVAFGRTGSSAASTPTRADAAGLVRARDGSGWRTRKASCRLAWLAWAPVSWRRGRPQRYWPSTLIIYRSRYCSAMVSRPLR